MGEGPLRQSQHGRVPGRNRSRRTRAPCTRRCGNTGKARGRTAASPGRTPASTSRWMAAPRGGVSRRACRRPTAAAAVHLRRRAQQPEAPVRACRRPVDRRRLPLGRRRRHVGAGQRRPPPGRRHQSASEEPGHRLRGGHLRVSLGRRRPDVDGHQRRAGRRRSAAALDQPAATGHHAADRRPGRDDLHQRRAHVEFLVQPAHGPALSRGHRQPVPLLGLRRAAGERRHRHRQPRQRRADLLPRLDRRRRRRVRLRRAGPAQPGHRLWRARAAVQPEDRTVAERGAGSAALGQVPHPADHAAAVPPGRSADAALRDQRPVEDDDRRPAVGDHQPRPLARAAGRAREHRRFQDTGPRHHAPARRDLCRRPVAEGRQPHLGRDRRRADPRDARRGRELEQRHAAGAPAVGQGVAAGGRPVRHEDGVCGGERHPARRHAPSHLPDARWRHDLDARGERAAGHGPGQRGARGPEAARPPVRRNGARGIRVSRRWRAMAAAAAEHARHIGSGSRHPRRRPGGGHPRAVDLDPGQHRAAARAGAGREGGARAPLWAARGGPRAVEHVLRHAVPARGTRGREPAGRRHARLLPGPARGRSRDRDPRWRGRRGAPLLEP